MRRRTAAVTLCAALLLSACARDVAPESTGTDTIADPGREFLVTTSDGLDLEARMWGDGDNYVVLAHMRPADMTSWFEFARLLADEGYTALAFNFRGYGESETDDENEFSVAVDVRAAVDAAVADGAAQVFVIGASMGGTGAVAASASNEIAGTVTLSAPDEFEGVNAASLAQFVDTPLLLIAADGDGDAAENALAIAAEAKREPELVVLSGDQHGTNMFAEHGDEITQLILDFLASA
jgi:pimeloyl-ACP methyl ester carboxylesterase